MPIRAGRTTHVQAGRDPVARRPVRQLYRVPPHVEAALCTEAGAVEVRVYLAPIFTGQSAGQRCRWRDRMADAGLCRLSW